MARALGRWCALCFIIATIIVPLRDVIACKMTPIQESHSARFPALGTVHSVRHSQHAVLCPRRQSTHCRETTIARHHVRSGVSMHDPRDWSDMNGDGNGNGNGNGNRFLTSSRSGGDGSGPWIPRQWKTYWNVARLLAGMAMCPPIRSALGSLPSVGRGILQVTRRDRTSLDPDAYYEEVKVYSVTGSEIGVTYLPSSVPPAAANFIAFHCLDEALSRQEIWLHDPSGQSTVTRGLQLSAYEWSFLKLTCFPGQESVSGSGLIHDQQRKLRKFVLGRRDPSGSTALTWQVHHVPTFTVHVSRKEDAILFGKIRRRKLSAELLNQLNAYIQHDFADLIVPMVQPASAEDLKRLASQLPEPIRQQVLRFLNPDAVSRALQSAAQLAHMDRVRQVVVQLLNQVLRHCINELSLTPLISEILESAEQAVNLHFGSIHDPRTVGKLLFATRGSKIPDSLLDSIQAVLKRKVKSLGLTAVVDYIIGQLSCSFQRQLRHILFTVLAHMYGKEEAVRIQETFTPLQVSFDTSFWRNLVLLDQDLVKMNQEIQEPRWSLIQLRDKWVQISPEMVSSLSSLFTVFDKVGDYTLCSLLTLIEMAAGSIAFAFRLIFLFLIRRPLENVIDFAMQDLASKLLGLSNSPPTNSH